MKNNNILVDIGTNKFVLLCLMAGVALGNLLVINFFTSFGAFSYLKVTILLLLLCCGFFIALRPNVFVTTRTLLLIIIPVLGVAIPPKRLGFSAFDIILIAILLMLLHDLFWRKKTIKLIPDKLAFVFFISVLPAVFLGISPIDSAVSFFKILLCYVFFITIHAYLSEKDAFVNIVKYLAVALTLVSLAIFFERVTGINLSGASKNLNAFVEGANVYRYGGFFQDPQKAGQFLAVGGTFLILLICQNVPLGRKITRLVKFSLLVSCAALLLTVSKNSILSGFFFSLIGIFFFNRNNQLKKKLLFIVPLVLFVLVAFSGKITSNFFASSLGARMLRIEQSANIRLNLWRDNLNLFKAHTVKGIGPGNYQEFLMRTDPNLRAKKAVGGYVPGQPESGYLKILFETGILGLVGLIIFFLGNAAKMMRCFLYSFHGKSSGIVVSASFAMIVFALCYITLFTTSDSRNAVIFIIMYAVFSNAKCQKKSIS
ncbi:O-antigen ligase family protein [Desulfogranum marinum]|uniref:O-antigen ligase family protein n=1 Tax=Desulfogranum marinum TaxID=453220 RepID=UPI0029C78015|nr:O-antigen ligase family protein [Desulfogranum marinum]